MEKPESSVAQQIARAAAAFVCQRTGHVPAAVEVAQSSEMLVITLHNARALAEQVRFRQSEGTAELHEVYRELFTESSDWLRREIGRITGLQMGAVTVADKAPTGAVVVHMTGSEPSAASQGLPRIGAKCDPEHLGRPTQNPMPADRPLPKSAQEPIARACGSDRPTCEAIAWWASGAPGCASAAAR